MRFAGSAFASPDQQFGSGGTGMFNSSTVPQNQFGDVAGIFPTVKRVLSRAGKLGEVAGGNVPGPGLAIGQISKDPTNQLAMQAIEAGGKFLPHVGALWLGINAGAAGPADEMKYVQTRGSSGR